MQSVIVVEANEVAYNKQMKGPDVKRAVELAPESMRETSVPGHE